MNGVMLDLGFVQIYWYSICIVLGMAVGMAFVYSEASKKGISESAMTDIIFYTVLIAIIGARLWYVIFEWGKYQNNIIGIFEIWHGGLAIHGAIIFGGLFLVLHSLKKKIDTLKLLDICSVGLIIGQAIGRWGNFFNQEVYGKAVSEGGKIFSDLFKILPGFIQEGMKIGGEYREPLFLYESILCLIGFIVLLIIRRRKYIKTGQIFGIYCMWYGAIRVFLEGMRDEEYNLTVGGFKVSQIVAIGMILVGLFFFIRRMRTSRFDHLYNDNIVLTNDKVEDDVMPYTGYSYDSTKDAAARINPKPAPKPVEPEDDSLLMNTTPVVNTPTTNIANNILNPSNAGVSVEAPTQPQVQQTQVSVQQTQPAPQTELQAQPSASTVQQTQPAQQTVEPTTQVAADNQSTHTFLNI